MLTSSPVRTAPSPAWKQAVIGPVTARLSLENKRLCDDPLSLEEVEKAIAGLGANKSPGSDGLTGEFYRKFKKKLAPILLRLFLDIESANRLPQSMSHSVITLLLKKGDKDKIENYRPISLLNCDYKVLERVASKA